MFLTGPGARLEAIKPQNNLSLLSQHTCRWPCLGLHRCWGFELGSLWLVEQVLFYPLSHLPSLFSICLAWGTVRKQAKC